MVYSSWLPEDAGLFALRREGETWVERIALTEASPYAYDYLPALSRDNEQVVFACADEPYQAQGTSICRVGIDGQGFERLIAPEHSPPGYPRAPALSHPAFEADGALLFSGDWGPNTRLWRVRLGTSEPPELVAPGFIDDHAPWVLPDGRIASLWWNAVAESDVVI